MSWDGAGRSGAASGEAPGDHDHHHRDAAQRELQHTNWPISDAREEPPGASREADPGGARPSRPVLRRFDEPAGPGAVRPAARDGAAHRDDTSGLRCRDYPHVSGGAGGAMAAEPRRWTDGGPAAQAARQPRPSTRFGGGSLAQEKPRGSDGHPAKARRPDRIGTFEEEAIFTPNLRTRLGETTVQPAHARLGHVCAPAAMKLIQVI